jgi:hypothetical protein
MKICVICGLRVPKKYEVSDGSILLEEAYIARFMAIHPSLSRGKLPEIAQRRLNVRF